jgi:hypothetical protein
LVIYLKHPKHGTKVAVSDDEAKADEQVGWVRFQVGALLTPEVPAPVNAGPQEIDVVREMWAEKFGKKPHHKKSIDTLKSELAA